MADQDRERTVADHKRKALAIIEALIRRAQKEKLDPAVATNDSSQLSVEVAIEHLNAIWDKLGWDHSDAPIDACKARSLLNLLGEELWRQLADCNPVRYDLPWWALELLDNARTLLSGITLSVQSPDSSTTDAPEQRGAGGTERVSGGRHLRLI